MKKRIASMIMVFAMIISLLPTAAFAKDSIDATAMTADELKTAVAAQLAAGKTDLEITLPANADSTMFAAIRRAITNTEGVADGSISLTLKGVTTIPDHDDSWYNNNVIFGGMWKDENGDYLEEGEFVTQLKSVNLPDVLTIGDKAFYGCENLTVLIAPKVQTIGEHAFCESGLTSVDLPEATTIGGFAFLGIKAKEFHLPKVTVLGNQTLDLGDINNEVTIYLTSADKIEVDEDCFYQMVNWYNSLATKVNLVLNDNKQSEVTDGNTWKGFTFKSIKFVPTVTSPRAIANLTYNGTPQTLIEEGKTTGGTLQYRLNGTDWSTDLPTGKDVGTYTVYYKVVGDTSFADVEEEHFDVTIAKATLTGISVEQDGTLTYDGTPQTPNVKTTAPDGSTVNFTYCTTENGTYGTMPAFTDAGTYKVYYKASAANHNDATGSFTVTIGKATPTVTTAPTATVTYGDAVNAKAIQGSMSVSGSFAWKNVTSYGDVGIRTLYATFTPTDGTNYETVENVAVSVTVSKSPYSNVTGVSGSAPYGATGTVNLGDYVVEGGTVSYTSKTDNDGVLNGDPTVSGKTLHFAFANVERNVGKSATVKLTVSITNFENYDIEVTLTVLDKQTPTVTVNPISKVYSGSALTDADISGDNNGVNGTWSWESNAPKDVADSTKTWTVVFTPTDSVNYKTVKQTVSVTITPVEVTISGLSVKNKTYDGTTTATVTGTAVVDGKIGNDDVTVQNGTAAFTDKNAGTGKTVTFSGYSLTGADAGNYTLTAQPTATTADIAQKSVTVSGVTAVDRAYKENDKTVALSGGTVNNVETGDTVTVDLTTAIGTMETPDASVSPKSVTVSGVKLAGTDAGNYVLSAQPDGVTVNISRIAYTGTTTANGSAKYGATGKEDLSNLIMSGGTATASVKTDTYNIVSDTEIVDLNKLQFTFNDDADLVGKTADIEVSVSGCTNYENYKITVTVTVNEKTVPIVTPPKAIENLTYNGSEQTLIKAATTTGGTLQYSLDNSKWSETLPTGKDAKTYTVYYRVLGDADYADSSGNNFTVTIDTASLTITADNKSAVVGATMPELTYSVSGLCGSDTLTTEPTLTCSPDMSKADSYPITVTGGNAGTNYTISNYVSGTLTVSNKQTPTLTLRANNTSLSGGGTVTLTVGGLPSGASCTMTCDNTSYNPTEKNGAWSVTLPNTTATYTFTVTFAGNSEYNGATATCTVSVTQYTAPSYSGGGSSGGNSSSNSNSTTTKNPDGSTTTTTTDKNTGTVTETTKNTDGSTTTVETKKDGTVTETNTTATGTTSTTVTDKNGNSETTVTVSSKDAASGETVPLPVDEMKPSTSENASEISVEVPKNTSVTVEVPVKDVTPGTVVMIVDENGKETVIPTTKMTENGVSVTLTENSTIKIVENSKEFSDVKDSDYFDAAVDFASSRGITGGTSATTFGPHESCTRAQLVTFLWRAAGQPEAKSESGMTDVANDTYYTEAVAWAFENGIVGGYGNGLFGSEDTITREQMATILYRFAQKTGMDTTQGGMQVREFSDYEEISDYAIAAMQWAVNTKIMVGYNNNLMPTAECTRAQIVTMLYRLLGK